MNDLPTPNVISSSASSPWDRASVLNLLARWAIGGCFIYMGLAKALHPVEFLKLVRQYQIVESPVLLNLLAGGLPWFEVFCGLLLLTGVAVRGTALLVVALLVPFTLVILNRALDIQSGGDLPFCAIKFNCGCGTGEANICGKLAANTLMAGISLALAVRRHHRWCLRTGTWGKKSGARGLASAQL